MAKVMIIDRDPERRASMVRFLKENGHETRIKEHAVSATMDSDIDWPEILLLADIPKLRSFKVVYQGSTIPTSTKNDMLSCLKLIRDFDHQRSAKKGVISLAKILNLH